MWLALFVWQQNGYNKSKKGCDQMAIKHLFLDLDGTLLDPSGQVSAHTAQVLRQSGLAITLVSARAPLEMMGAIQALQLTSPQIAFNGGLLFQPGQSKLLHATPIPLTAVSQVLAVMRHQFPQVSCSYYTATHWYTQRLDRGVIMESQLTGQQAQVQPDLPPDAIFKIMLIMFDEATMTALQQALLALKLPTISIKRSGQLYLEITSRQAQKSTGIAAVFAAKQLVKAETAAFGDGENDLPMLQAVGVPIVMGNARPDIKAYGQYVTKSNAADGVAYGVQKWLLQ